MKGRSISCIIGFGISFSSRFGISGAARPCLWDRRLAGDAYFALAFTKTVTHTLELDPGARWSAGRVRVRTDRPVSLRRTTGTRERCRWPARPPPRTGAQPWRGPGCWAQSPKPKARSEAPMHPSPPNFNAGTRGHGKRNNRAFPLFQTKKHLVDALKTKLGNSFGGIECVLAL